MRYILTGGGTGGHVYPALAVAEAVKALDGGAEFLYVGARGGAEARIVGEAGYKLILLSASGFPRRLLSGPAMLFFLQLALGIVKAAWILLTYRPAAVFGTGGYAAAPVMIACWLLRRLRLSKARLYAHESNARPGRLNQLAGRLADMMFTSHHGSQRFLPPGRSRLVGYPVRTGAVGPDKEAARAALELPADGEVVFVVGGSQGARTINRATVAALPSLLKRPRLHVLHAVGPARGGSYHPMEDVERVLEVLGLSQEELVRYRRMDYVWEMGLFYSASDLVVCRAGAGTLAETSAAGRPVVVIPKSGLPGDHQVRNAIEAESAGAGAVVYERHWPGRDEEVDGHELATVVLELLGDPHRLCLMGEKARSVYRPDAALVMAEAMVRAVLPPPTSEKRVVSWVERAAGLSPLRLADETRRRLAAGAGGQDVPGPRELSYLRHKALEFLASSQWQVRNAGVKMAGLLRLAETTGPFCQFLTAQADRGWWGRMLFGSHEQVGFVRRNSATSLAQIGLWDGAVRDALLAGLGDSYFEVRSSAARALGVLLRDRERDREVEAALRGLLAVRCFEVVREGCLALGRVGTEPGSVARVTALLDHPNWKVRDAVLRALGDLIERGVARAEDVHRGLRRLLVTSTDFRAVFPLKQGLHRLQHIIAERGNRKDAE